MGSRDEAAHERALGGVVLAEVLVRIEQLSVAGRVELERRAVEVHHRAAVAGGKTVAARVDASHPEPHLGVVVPVGRDEHADGGGAEPTLREPDQGQDDGRDEREHGERKDEEEEHHLPPEIAPPAGSLEARALVTIRTQLP